MIILNHATNWSFHIDSNSDAIIGHIKNMFSMLLSDAGQSGLFDSIFIEDCGGDDYLIRFSRGNHQVHMQGIETTLGFIGNILYDSNYLRMDNIWYLHGGACAIDKERAIILLAPRNVGKTTLTGLLCEKLGFTYLSDDIAPVQMDDLAVLPFPKSLYIRSPYLQNCLGSDYHMQFSDSYIFTKDESRQISERRQVAYFPAHKFASRGKYSIAAVFYLDRDSEYEESYCIPKSSASSFTIYLNNCRDSAQMIKNKDTAVKMIHKYPLWHLRFSESEDAIELIKNTLCNI